MIQVNNPYPQFFDADGDPLDNGKVYFGVADLDPRTNPKVVYSDYAGTTPVTQPVRTQNGYLVNGAGTPISVYVDGDYSIAAYTSADVLLWSAPDSKQYNIEQRALDIANTAIASVDVLRSDLASTSSGKGASLIGFKQSGTGSQQTTVQQQIALSVNVFQFMTPEQIADVKANTAASNLSAALDVTSAIQAAINYAATRASVGGCVYFPPGSYKTTAKIVTHGAGGVGQVGIVGSGRFSTRFFPAGDFTVFNIVSSYVDSGDFSIEWPTTVFASIPTSRIGVEFANADWQSSYTTLKNITVNYAYRGFVLNDWTGQPYGTAYLIKLKGLTAFRCTDWGIWLNSKTGSTTLVMEQCYVRGDDSTSTPKAKGVYINNFNDVTLISQAVDQCVDSWLQVVNSNNLCAINTAFEACRISTSTANAVSINSVAAIFSGVKCISNTYDTGGNAKIFAPGANCVNISITGMTEQDNNIASGTTKYKLSVNAAGTHAFVNDRSCLPIDVLDNGWFANIVYEGERRSSLNLAPNYGTWVRGDHVKTGAPTVGAPKGWYCTASGSPGTWVSEGNL